MSNPASSGDRSASTELSPMEQYQLEKQLEQSVITLNSARLELRSPQKFERSYSLSEPKWRYFESQEPLTSPSRWPTAKTQVRIEPGGQTWAIEVGRVPDAGFTWRATFSEGYEWDENSMRSLEEPATLANTMSEIYKTFVALRGAHDIESVDDQEILSDLGQFVESRLEIPIFNAKRSSDSRNNAKVVHIGSQDYDLLQLGFNHVDPPPVTFSREDKLQRACLTLKPDAIVPAPSYFRQVTDSEPNSKRKNMFHIVVSTEISAAGKITAETSLVMPWHVADIEAVPEWVPEMVAGEGPYGERWKAAMTSAIEGFNRYSHNVAAGKLSQLEKTLLKSSYNFHPAREKKHALDSFLTSVLQNEIEDIISEAPTGGSSGKGKRAAPSVRVSGMTGMLEHSLERATTSGLFRVTDLRGPPTSMAQNILGVIKESLDRQKEEEEAEAYRKERERIRQELIIERERQALGAIQDAPPTYEMSTGASGAQSHRKQDDELTNMSSKSGKCGSRVDDDDQTLTAVSDTHLNVQLPSRTRSKSPRWYKRLCSSRSDL